MDPSQVAQMTIFNLNAPGTLFISYSLQQTYPSSVSWLYSEVEAFFNWVLVPVSLTQLAVAVFAHRKIPN